MSGDKNQTTEQLLEQRGRTHGEYSEHARCTQAILRACEVERNWADLPDIVRESIHMIAHKLGRVVTGHALVQDHWDDIGGYAKLVSQRIEAESTTTPGALVPGHRPEELWRPPIVSGSGRDVYTELAAKLGLERYAVKLALNEVAYGVPARREKTGVRPVMVAPYGEARGDGRGLRLEPVGESMRDRLVPRQDPPSVPGTPEDGGQHARTLEYEHELGARVRYVGSLNRWRGLRGVVCEHDVRVSRTSVREEAVYRVRWDLATYLGDAEGDVVYPEELRAEEDVPNFDYSDQAT